jgi:4-carboxymuconolactone decarboxylase
VGANGKGAALIGGFQTWIRILYRQILGVSAWKTPGYARYFSGASFLNLMSDPPKQCFWQMSPLNPAAATTGISTTPRQGGGQILLCIAGRGYNQEWEKEARELHPGDVVVIPPEVKHWHGAAPDSWFSHIVLDVPGKESNNEWCEPVSEGAYKNLK